MPRLRLALVLAFALVALPPVAACSLPGAPMPAAQVVTHDGVGTIVAIAETRKRVQLDHEAMGDYMDAMTMWFPVAEPALLDGLETGTKVRFTVTERENGDVITSIGRAS